MKELLDSFNDLSQTYKEFDETVRSVTYVVKPLKHLVGKPGLEEGNGCKLITVGAALIAFPDPFIVTDIAGSALVAAGLIKNRLKQAEAADVSREFNKEVRKLMEITKELNLQTHLSWING